jgi:hypothetical protein
MMKTKRETTTRRLPERPRMNVRESNDEDSWRRTATMWLADVERLCGVEPEGVCERGEPGGCPSYVRRPCDSCGNTREWLGKVLALVRNETGWRLYSYARGPGYAFASDPCVYSPRKHPTVLVVTWSGGLDI